MIKYEEYIVLYTLEYIRVYSTIYSSYFCTFKSPINYKYTKIHVRMCVDHTIEHILSFK